MSVNYTDEQKKVISLRGSDLLVSAAAGSGKTAVLVERILSRITDPDDPVDVDRLLIVTFTRAAAGEMRERISQAIEARLQADPENEHLQRQSVLLPGAQISTIHGFCTRVIRNYFHLTDIDPGYRVGSEEGELTLLAGEVAQAILEEAYEAADPAFLAFSEGYAPGRTDKALEGLILRIHKFSMASPDPEGWLDACLSACEVGEDALEDLPWIREILEEARRIVRGAIRLATDNLLLVEGPGGPPFYREAFASDLESAETLASCRTYADYYAACQAFSFRALGRKKKADLFDPEVQELAKAQREAFKENVKLLQQNYFSDAPEEVCAQLAEIRPHIRVLVELTRSFSARYREAKREKNILDFSDLEHEALGILLRKTEDGWERTDAARELAAQFTEVMCDEYQDSNLLQEQLLAAVSGTEEGRHDRFMVGDIKQSIYGFRMARPDLFLKKYETYENVTPQSSGDGAQPPQCRIDLRRNFRSRASVLEAVNEVFRRLMTASLGGITYDADAALYFGAADYPEGDPETELLLIDQADEAFEEDHTKRTMVETEAMLVAQQILALRQSGVVYDAKIKQTRAVRYRDIVVLLRSGSGWAEPFVRVLTGAGIPAYATARTGYFSTLEVETLLNYLRILDNPLQDIPCAAVLRSPICGCTDEGLAELRAAYRGMPLYNACVRAAEEEQIAEGIRKKVSAFLEQYHALRGRLTYTPVSELIRQILAETGYGNYAAAMPAGAQREANLNMLITRAVVFESGSEHGLFAFLRYIEQLEKYSVDYGEVNLYGEVEDVVRVMTIHKSKGLEFPVVFLSGCGNRMNKQDSQEAIVQHATYGIGMDAVDTQMRTKRSTLLARTIKDVIKRDALGEELRVLYVAMTRAKERLILTGAVKDAEKVSQKYSRLQDEDGAVPYRERVAAKTYLDWILPAIALGAPIRQSIIDPQTLGAAQIVRSAGRSASIETLREACRGSETPFDPEIAEMIAARRPVDASRTEPELPAKLSVSEIKRRSMEEMSEDGGTILFEEPPVIPLIPAFMQQNQEAPVSGAARGTQFHAALACLDLSEAETEAQIRVQIDRMTGRGILDSEAAAAIDAEALLAFAASPIGQRMRAAQVCGTLRREQPFVVNIPADEIDPAYGSGKPILVQGVIDAYFEENGNYVIVDYKTDRVRDGAELVRRYRTQLLYYKRALEQILEVPVKEMILYSIWLGQELPVDAS